MEMEGSSIASVALILWIPISIAAFKLFNPMRASVYLLLGAVMFLPEREQFRIPAIPTLTKLTIGTICVFIGVLLTSRRRLFKTPWPKPVPALLVILAVGAIGSIATNLDPVKCGLGYCDALLPHTTLTFLLEYFFLQLIPFWVGMTFFSSRANFRTLLTVLVGAGLIYSLLIIVEARLSPQLHTWVYGYMQHSWTQTLRGGGYRPMVFMTHGLTVSLFIACCAVAATGCARAHLRIFRTKALFIATYLLAILILCRSLAALIYGVGCILLIALTSPKTQLRVAVVVCILAIGYPILRATDLFPTKELVELSSQASTDRGASLGFRFFNEDMLLEKALQRPLFGWGGFDRIRIFDEYSGADLSVTDGYWIIIFSSRGVLGFTAIFTLLIFPIVLAYRRIDKVNSRATQALIAALGLIATINIVDLIPNGLFHYLPFLYSGALLGVVERLTGERAIRAARAVRPTAKASVPGQAAELCPQPASLGAAAVRSRG
jgi:hypothetical protein